MHALLNPAAQPLTMSSREVATLTGKRHDHVLRDIRTMLVTLYGEKEVDEGIPDKDMFEVFCDRMGWGIASPELGNERIQGVTVVRDQRGFVSEIGLDYTHSMTLVSGYNVKVRKAIIDRWQQLEAGAALAAPAALDLRDPRQLARLALQLANLVLDLQQQAEAPKPHVTHAVTHAVTHTSPAAARKQRERRARAEMFERLRAQGISMKSHVTTGELRAAVAKLNH